MQIDPTAFTIPAPRVLIGPGERALVHAALYWGMPERRGDQSYDPVQVMWGQTGHSPVDTETHGFSLKELGATRAVLCSITTDPSFTERPTADCLGALKLVEFAMRMVGWPTP